MRAFETVSSESCERSGVSSDVAGDTSVLRQAQDEGRYPSSLVQAGASLKGDTMDPCLHRGLRNGEAGFEGWFAFSVTLDRVAV